MDDMEVMQEEEIILRETATIVGPFTLGPCRVGTFTRQSKLAYSRKYHQDCKLQAAASWLAAGWTFEPLVMTHCICQSLFSRCA